MKKILIIEDDELIIDSVVDLFETEGYKVFQANNGRDGIALARKNLPDIIISDIAMPGISGYDVLKELQADDEMYDIPFIFLTAKVEKSDFRMGMELGADDYLTKPFSITELLKAVEARLKKKEQIQARPHPAEPAAKKFTDDEHILIEDRTKPVLVKISSILFITAEAEYSFLNLADKRKIMVRKLLKKWEEILPEKSFLRISRSAIINLNHLARIEKWFNNAYMVYIKNVDEPLIVSRRYAASIRSRLS